MNNYERYTIEDEMILQEIHRKNMITSVFIIVGLIICMILFINNAKQKANNYIQNIENNVTNNIVSEFCDYEIIQ